MASELLQSLRSVLTDRLTEASDQELLDRYVRDLDEAAFAALAQRHGPMVRSVCRRILSDPDEVDDAFQATFLILVRRAGTIRKRSAIAAWLYGVARRVAWKLRKRRMRQRQAEVNLPTTTSEDSSTPLDDLKQTLDREIAALPERYRAPLVLCCLEGMTRDEAAQALGWSVGSVKGRLERGRRLLKQRLAKQGICLSLAGLMIECSPQASLSRTALDPVLKFAAGWGAKAIPDGISSQAWELARWYLAKSVLARIATGAIVALSLVAGITMGWSALDDTRDRATTVAATSTRKGVPMKLPSDVVADKRPQRAAGADRDEPKPAPELRQPPARRGRAYAVVIGRSSPAQQPRIRLSVNGQTLPVQILHVRNKTASPKKVD